MPSIKNKKKIMQMALYSQLMILSVLKIHKRLGACHTYTRDEGACLYTRDKRGVSIHKGPDKAYLTYINDNEGVSQQHQ